MPMYEYVCDSCDKVYEFKQSMTEDPLKKCPKGHRGFRRIISNTSFVLKGGGWYKDGYGSGKSKSSDSDSAPAKSSEVSTSSGHGCGGACTCGAN